MVWLGGFLSSLNKTAVNKGFPVFVAPVRDGFGASNAAVSLIFSLARAESGPTGPMAGWFIDRFGPRLALFVGALMSGGGFLALGYTTSLWAFACIYLLVVTAGANLGFSYALSTLINNWFYRRKALAMSVFQAVDSFLPAVLVGVMALAIAALSWQTTAKIIGLVLLVVILPLSFFIKDAPERMGLTMDGDPPGGAPDPPRPSTRPAQPVGAARLASPRRIQHAPDAALLGVLEPDRGHGIAIDRESWRDGAYHPHYGE